MRSATTGRRRGERNGERLTGHPQPAGTGTERGLTSTDEADGAEQARLRVVHLQRQQLPGKRKHQVCERAEARVVHLGPVQGQAV